MYIAIQNFIKISQTVAELSHLTAGKLGRTNMCQYVRFCQNWPNGLEDITIFHSSRWPPSAINFQKIGFEELICIVITIFVKIGQTITEILHLTFSKMVAVCRLGFFKI